MTLLSKEQLKTMMDLQSEMNAKVNPEWRKANYAWDDAILTEAVEAYDYTNWAWWKNVGKESDKEQIKLELVDIWHFILSEVMSYDEDPENTYHDLITVLAKHAQDSKPEDFDVSPEAIREALKNIMRAALAPANPERVVLIVHSFAIALGVLDISWNELYKLYLGKNCLNQFRQANGYKKDTAAYKAKWALEKGWEDNQYLFEILSTLDVTSPDYVKDIKTELEKAFEITMRVGGNERNS